MSGVLWALRMSPSSSALGRLGIFAGDVLIMPLDVAVCLPDRVAGFLVERDDVLLVNAVEREDHEILEEHDRGGGAAVVAAGEVVALPEDFTRRGVEAGGAVAAEVDVHAAGLDGGRR